MAPKGNASFASMHGPYTVFNANAKCRSVIGVLNAFFCNHSQLVMPFLSLSLSLTQAHMPLVSYESYASVYLKPTAT